HREASGSERAQPPPAAERYPLVLSLRRLNCGVKDPKRLIAESGLAHKERYRTQSPSLLTWTMATSPWRWCKLPPSLPENRGTIFLIGRYCRRFGFAVLFPGEGGVGDRGKSRRNASG